MRFAASVLAFASAVLAANLGTITTPAKDAVVPAGKPFTIEWENPAPYDQGSVRIDLLSGKTHTTLQNPVTIATVDAKDKQYVWDVKSSLGDDAAYGIHFVWVKDETVDNWSQPFTIKKAEGGDSNSNTVTVTSSQGAKTVTLSSVTSTTTTTTTTTTTNTTTAVTSTSTKSVHNTTSVAPTLTTTTPANTETVTQTSPPTTKPSSGAARTAGSVAVIGGIVAAMLAL